MSQETLPVPSSSTEGLNLSDIEKALKDDSDSGETTNLLADDKVQDKKETKKEDKEKPESKDESEEELKLSEDEEEPTEEELAIQTPPRKKEILAKYPNLFKEFPYLAAAYYREQQFTEINSTPEEAREVKERAEEFTKFESAILSGNTESLLKSVKGSDEQAFAKIVDDYLPALARTDQNAYVTVLGNVITGTIKAMVQESARLGNEDLKAAALLLNQFCFGNSQPREEVKFNKQPQQTNDEQTRLQEERDQFAQERFNTAVEELSTRVDNVLKSTINQNIDPKGAMTDYVKKQATRDAFEELDSVIAADTRFRATQDRLWAEAMKQNYPKKLVDAIRSNYLGKAKNLLPSILQKHRNEAMRGLGKRVNEAKKEEPERSERRQSVASNTEKKQIPHTMKTLDYLNQD